MTLSSCKIAGILVKGMYELWGEGSSYDELEEAIRNYPDENKLPYLVAESTFKITVDSFGKIISFQEQNDRIRGLTYIPFKVLFFFFLSFFGTIRWFEEFFMTSCFCYDLSAPGVIYC